MGGTKAARRRRTAGGRGEETRDSDAGGAEGEGGGEHEHPHGERLIEVCRRRGLGVGGPGMFHARGIDRRRTMRGGAAMEMDPVLLSSNGSKTMCRHHMLL